MNVVDLTLQTTTGRWPAIGPADGGEDQAGARALSLDELKAGGGEPTEIAGKIAVRISTGESAGDLRPVLHRLGLVAIDFPDFKDGRGFSLARRVIADFGFSGELRATGWVLPDQALFLRRCGFDTVEFADAARAEEARRALRRFNVWYQGAIDGSRPAHRLRRARPAAE